MPGVSELQRYSRLDGAVITRLVADDPTARSIRDRRRAVRLSLYGRIRSGIGDRSAGLVLALLAEALLVMALLTLTPTMSRPRGEERPTVFSFSPEREQAIAPETEEEADPPPVETDAREPRPVEAPAEEAPDPAPLTPAPPIPIAPAPPPVIQLSREQMAAADLARLPSRAPAVAPPRRAVAGPPNVGGSAGADTPRVEGTGPNGEPLYAAAWYREPYPEELRGYLSTSRGPGWGLIACRTVRDYRVEDCVALGEYPEGSNIARSVLAAAWQFRVRPPRLGGMPKIGEWVRIRIDYDLRRD